jgi:addiction module RelE/StbE family toxin
MRVRFSQRFVKQLAKLTRSQQRAAYTRIDLLLINPDDPILRRHRLAGPLRHLYSIDISGDIRALYQVIDGEAVIFQLIGTHSSLYG